MTDNKKVTHYAKTQRTAHWRIAIEIVQILSSLGSLAGFAYLIADLQFQSAPSIAPAASDPKDPFRFPFLLVNNSHLTSLRNVSWSCHIDVASMMDGSEHRNMDTPKVNPVKEVGPGQILNLQCMNIPKGEQSATKELTMSVDVQYESDVLPFVRASSHQQSSFEWYAGASAPQWLRK